MSPIGSSLASMGTATFSITISFLLSTLAGLDCPELHACDASTTSVLSGAAIAGVKSIITLGLPFYSKKFLNLYATGGFRMEGLPRLVFIATLTQDLHKNGQ